MTKLFHRLDLNLLITLQILLQERSVTKAAKKLSVTPSAVSKSLNKLRDWFGDPLFVRTPLGLQPTPLSISMEKELGEWFQIGAQLSAKQGTVTPKGVNFQLMMESPLHTVFLGGLPSLIAAQYPDSVIKIRDWNYDAIEAITSGEADIGFSGRETHHRSQESLALLPYYISYEVMFEDRPLVFIREDHPVLDKEWNMDTFIEHSHINIIWEAHDSWALDEVLAAQGRKRDISLSMPNFDQSLFMAAQPDHDLLTTAPAYCLKHAATRYPNLITKPLPLSEAEYQELTISFALMWHKRNTYNPKLVWLRETIKSLMPGNSH